MTLAGVDLVKTFEQTGRRRTTTTTTAVQGVSFELRPAETLGLVGESGSGKSTLARIVLGLLDATSGHVEFEGRRLDSFSGADWREYRRRVQVVFQDPRSALNWRVHIEEIVTEPLRNYGTGDRRSRRARATELLEQVGVSPKLLERRPPEVSGGQLQRVAIARALALAPSYLVCDEPLSALDVSVQAGVMNLLLDLQAGARALAPVHLPRSRGRAASERPGDGHVPGRDRRARDGRRDLQATATHLLADTARHPRQAVRPKSPPSPSERRTRLDEQQRVAVAVDIGGTFTDLAVRHRDGSTLTTKTLTTPRALEEGVVPSFARRGSRGRTSVSSSTEQRQASTPCSSAASNRRAADHARVPRRVRDREGKPSRDVRPSLPSAAALVPRRLRLEVTERMSAQGEVILPLDEESLRLSADALVAEGVGAMALVLLHAYANPAHELRCEELLQSWYPSIPVSVSHRIANEWREYERTSTTVVNAAVAETVDTYLASWSQSSTRKASRSGST